MDKTMRILLAVCSAAVFALAAGCQPSRPDTVDVSGKITYGGGAWPKPGKLTFPCTKAAEGYPSRPGAAAFDIDGNFVAGTYDIGDGLQPGTYSVNVECWETEPTMDNMASAKSYVPENFQATFEVLPTDRYVTLQWEVPKPVR
jgi:hypothetical protein